MSDLLLLELPSTGTLVLGLATAILAALNGIQWWQKESARRLKEQVGYWQAAAESGKTTVTFAEAELKVVRERAERIEGENADLKNDNAVLRARTDLDSLKGQTAAVEQLLRVEVQRSQEMHQAILNGMRELTSTVGEMHERFVARDEQYQGLIGSQSALIKSLQSQLNLKDAMRL
jgi:hypothetical protein